jgi:hypothetical protein
MLMAGKKLRWRSQGSPVSEQIENFAMENEVTEENAPRKNAEFTRGRPFAKGNAGRPPGAKNRATAIAHALLAGEEAELVRKEGAIG